MFKNIILSKEEVEKAVADLYVTDVTMDASEIVKEESEKEKYPYEEDGYTTPVWTTNTQSINATVASFPISGSKHNSLYVQKNRKGKP